MRFSIRSDNKKFNRFVRDFVRTSDKESGEALKDIAISLMRGVVAKWPVDKRVGRGGRSRAAFLVSLEILTGKKKIMPMARGGNTNPKEVRQGRKLGQLRKRLKGKNQFIEIINKVHYVTKLEYGYSMQAPYGVVRREMRKLRKGTMPEKLGNRLVRKWNRGW